MIFLIHKELERFWIKSILIKSDDMDWVVLANDTLSQYNKDG